MSDQPDRASHDGQQDFLTKPIQRSDFLKTSGKLAVGAVGLSGLGSALGSAPAWASAGRAAAASNKVKKIAVIEQVFAPFFTENFNKPMAKYLSTHKSGAATTMSSPAGWGSVLGDEKGSVPTGINLLNEYVAQNYGGLILSTGDEMTAWAHAVKQATKSGAIFINHSTQAVAGATQNTLFSHKGAGVGIGTAAVQWAHKHGIKAPVVGLLGNLTDAQGSKRTTWAWKTIKAAFPNAQLAGSVQGIDLGTGTTGAANLLSAHPNINILIAFNTIAGTGAMTSATHAGKTDRNQFFLGITDFETETLNMIAAGNSIIQANWGTYFPASMVLMLRDIINHYNGKPIYPTRLLLGEAIVTPSQARTFNKVVFDPMNPKNAYVYTKYFKYVNQKMGNGQVPPGQ